ncbi:tyrosine-type recombinase/integrase [Tenacibaculum agarivorans]|uniref:tyrosine-type recombinase/integrase n=1 Tax=Tenacibaculum agarivorans TaxID=1908389 RepID=UPI00094BB627|nr:tyrosine-type recombinase/integrase [Tenacibaculum agarivorans]
MASVKVVLRKEKQKKDGTYPLAIRIIKDRKPKYIHTDQSIDIKFWDSNERRVKKSHPNSKRLNNYLLAKLKEANDIALELEENNRNISSQDIKKKVKRTSKNTSFFQLGAERVNNKYHAGTYSVANSELSILYNIEEFLNLKKSGSIETKKQEIQQRRKDRISKARKQGRNIPEEIKYFSKLKKVYFDDIDFGFIERFKSFCSSYLDQKPRTITNQLIFVRTLYNLAIKEKVTDGKNYPFAGEKEKIRIKSGNKIGLNKTEISKIEKLKLEKNTSIWHTKNVFLFSYYFAGVRISDVVELKWHSIIDGRLYYQMNKNEKPVSLKVPEQALDILKQYKSSKTSTTDYIFPFLKKADPNSREDLFVKMRNATNLFNKYLKRIAELCGIEKNLSNHIARHSFGNIAGDKIDPRMLQKLYRHSNLKTTIGYQANFIHKDADDALETVLNS